MSKSATIRRVGNLIDVSADGESPLDSRVLTALQHQLMYTHLHRVYGYQHGQRSGDVIAEHRKLYQIDSAGRLVCFAGWLPRIRRVLKSYGYEDIVEVWLRDPPEWDATEDWEYVNRVFEFRPRQRECLEAITKHERGVIDAVPAFGKMWIIWMVCMLYPKAKIHIVSKRRDVIASIRNLGYRFTTDIGQVGGGKNRPGRVTLFTADSLHKSQGDADILLCDEVHELMTDRYYRLLSRYHHARMFGFTATKETRGDQAHERMEGLFGETIFRITDTEAVNLGLVVPKVVQWLDVTEGPAELSQVKDTVRRKRIGIWRNEYRNRVIAAVASEFLSLGMQTLILVDTMEHLLFLRKLLPEFECCYSEGALIESARVEKFERLGLLDDLPPMTPQRREELRQRFERREFLGAIATGVWSTGVSFDALEVLIRATGGSAKTASIQVPGRVGRVSTDTQKPYGILVDFMDKFDEGFRRQSLARMRVYKGEKWIQYDARGKRIQ